jgi:hypothetical protein
MSDQPDQDDRSAWAQDAPGDPACWLRRVCPQCGAMAASDPPTTCPRCDAAMPAD